MPKNRRARRRAQGPVNKYVGRRLRTIRLAQGMTYQEASKRAGIPLSSYSCLERGWYKLNVEHLYRMVQALRAEVAEVFPASQADLDRGGNGQSAQSAAGKPDGPVRIEDVLRTVSKIFKVSPRKLVSSERWSRLQEARGACGILVREISGLRLRSLSKRLGMTESALARLVRQHRKQAKQDPDLASRLRSARKALVTSTKDTKVHEILPL